MRRPIQQLGEAKARNTRGSKWWAECREQWSAEPRGPRGCPSPRSERAHGVEWSKPPPRQNFSLPARLAGVQCKALNGSTPSRNSWHSPAGRGGVSIPPTTRLLALGLPHDRHGSPAMKILRNSRAPRQKSTRSLVSAPPEDRRQDAQNAQRRHDECGRRRPPRAAAVSGAREFSRRCAPSTGRHMGSIRFFAYLLGALKRGALCHRG
jgi:hypothetical protein